MTEAIQITVNKEMANRMDDSNSTAARHARDPVAKALVAMIAPRLKADRPAPCPAGCDHALGHALITSPAVRSAEMVTRLDAVAGRVLKK